MSSALKGNSNHTLMLWACTGLVMRKNLRVRGHKAAQSLVVLVIKETDLVAAEVTSFLKNWLHSVL
jgi:hypothetical protein